MSSVGVREAALEGARYAQPLPVTIALIANLLLWGYPIPVGVGTLAPNAVITVICGCLIGGRKYRSCTRPFWLAIAACAYGCCVVPFSPFAPNIAKLVFSVALFVCCAFALRRLAERVNFDVPVLSPAAAWSCLALVAATVIAHTAVRLMAGSQDDGLMRASGLYAEPSHLALSITPLIFYLCRVSSTTKKLIAGACAILLLALASSFSFVLLLVSTWLFWFIARLRLPRFMDMLLSRVSALTLVSRAAKGSAILALVVVLAAGFSASALAGHSLERAAGVFNTQTSESGQLDNLSSAVYLNGWLDMAEYLRSTHGLGVGFNQMGATGRPDTWITRMLSLAGLGDQNATEGSFILSKLGSELGIVGILVWIAFLSATVIVCRRALHRRANMDDCNVVLLFAMLAIIGVGGVIRSTPYFSGPFQLALFAMYLTFAGRSTGWRIDAR